MTKIASSIGRPNRKITVASLAPDKIERIATEKEKAKLSCVEAQVVRQSDSKYKLKVWNSGNVNVYKVSAKIEEDSNIYISDSKMPFDELEPGKGFTENMRVILGSAPKFKITTLWEEADGSTHEKTQMGEI